MGDIAPEGRPVDPNQSGAVLPRAIFASANPLHANTVRSLTSVSFALGTAFASPFTPEQFPCVTIEESKTKSKHQIMSNMKVIREIFTSVLSVGSLAALGQLTAHADTNTAPVQADVAPKTSVVAPATPEVPATAQTTTTSPLTFHTTKFAMAGASSSLMGSGQEENDQRFHKGEWDFSPFAAYVDKVGGKWGAGAAATYFILNNLGIGAATYWTDWSGSFFDNVEFEGYFRIPLLKVVAPYAVGSIGYQFDGEYWFETIGAGVDFRPFKNISAFGDGQFRITNDGSKNGAFLRLGIRLTF
jgi:hypothetical protein